MAYFYVKSGGTATGTQGKYLTLQTGSWSTTFSNTNQYYNDIYTVSQQTTVAANDVIYVSDLHDYTRIISSNISIPASNKSNVICVNDTDLTLFSTGAKESYSNSSGTLYTLTFTIYYAYGITFDIIGNLRFYLNSVNSRFDNCNFKVQGNDTSENYHRFMEGTGFTHYVGCIIEFDTTTNWVYPSHIHIRGTETFFINCQFKGYANSVYPIFSSVGLTHSTFVKLYFLKCDFSQIDRPIFLSDSTNFSQTLIPKNVVFDRCSFHANSKSSTPLNTHLLTSNDFSSSNEITTGNYVKRYFQYGTVETVSSVYRSGGANFAYEFNEITQLYENKYPFCYKITTYDFNRNRLQGFRFKLTDFYWDFTSPSKLSLYIVQESGAIRLTNKDILIDVFYPDDLTTKAHFKTSGSYNLLDEEFYYPSSGATWQGLVDNCFKQTIETNLTDLGSYGLCSVWVNVHVPNKIIYICPKPKLE